MVVNTMVALTTGEITRKNANQHRRIGTKMDHNLKNLGFCQPCDLAVDDTWQSHLVILCKPWRGAMITAAGWVVKGY